MRVTESQYNYVWAIVKLNSADDSKYVAGYAFTPGEAIAVCKLLQEDEEVTGENNSVFYPLQIREMSVMAGERLNSTVQATCGVCS